MTKELKAIIVDDERLARRELRSLLVHHPRIKIINEADSVRRAAELIAEAKPDVVFLDIQMPGQSGFDLFEMTDANFDVIFVTAFDQYAIRAFEVNALDYLLKPIAPRRLAQAIEKLSEKQTSHHASSRKLEYDDHIFLSLDDRFRFIKVSAIRCITAQGDYTEIYTADDKSLALKALREWEERLPEKHFVRIHRSTIVNFEHIEKIEKWFNNSYLVHIRGLADPVILSRRYAARLKVRFA